MRKRLLLSSFNLCNKTFNLLLFGLLLVISTENIVLAQDIVGKGKSGRVISFSGYDWLVKSSANTLSGTLAPGNNYFSDSRENVWVDKNGWLHLKITLRDGKWYCAEVALTKALGYKKYIFHVFSRFDHFHPNVVGGLFTYLDGTDQAEEMDIEFSKWGDDTRVNNELFSIQPSEKPENAESFKPELNGNATTHIFDWKPGKVEFSSYHGHYSSEPTDSTLIIRKWDYSGEDVPKNQNGRIHINLWLFHRENIDLYDHPENEIVIKYFQAL
jgi:hypothetical protein